MSLASLLNRTVSLERPNNVQDEVSGVLRQSWATIVSDAPAAIQPLSAVARHQFAQRQIYVTHRIYFAADVEPQRTDRIRVTSPATDQLFIIHGFFNQAGRDFLWSIDAQEQTT